MSLILSGTDGVSDVDGTAATPAIRGTDTNTGIFFPAADTIAFAEGGVESARFDSAGNLGIGTSSPAVKLDVNGRGSFQGLTLGVDGTYVSPYLTLGFSGNTNGSTRIFGTNNNSDNLYLAAGTGRGVTIWTNGSTANVATFDASGNLGLGVTPSAGSTHIDVSAGGSLYGLGTGAQLSANAYFSGAWLYRGSGRAARIDVNGGDVGGIQFFTASTSGTAGNAISFTQAMTLDASGNLGVGTTSPQGRLHVRASTASMFFQCDDTGQVQLNFGGTTNAVKGGIYYSDNSDVMWFRTGSTERARIDSSGNLLVGRTSQLSTERFAVYTASQSWAMSIENARNTSADLGAYISLGSNTNNTGSFFVSCVTAGFGARIELRGNGGIANFQANNVNLSDRREKTNFAPAGEYLSKICAIPVQTFNYIDQSEDDPGLTLGVVAQDVQAVAPELVTESNWGTAEEPKMRLSIYQTDLQYALMKCIQEQQAIIQTLTTRIAALEAK